MEWRGRQSLRAASGYGFAAIDTHGRDTMTLNLDHIDELYVLQEAIDAFIANCDRDKQWRAVAAAETLAARLAQIARDECPA